MIHKEYAIGKHNTLMVEFGIGDILIQNATAHDNSQHIYFIQAEPGLINEEREGWKFEGLTSDAIPNIPVALRFTKPESIDVLINSLQEAKQKLNMSNNGKTT